MTVHMAPDQTLGERLYNAVRRLFGWSKFEWSNRSSWFRADAEKAAVEFVAPYMGRITELEAVIANGMKQEGALRDEFAKERRAYEVKLASAHGARDGARDRAKFAEDERDEARRQLADVNKRLTQARYHNDETTELAKRMRRELNEAQMRILTLETERTALVEEFAEPPKNLRDAFIETVNDGFKAYNTLIQLKAHWESIEYANDELMVENQKLQDQLHKSIQYIPTELNVGDMIQEYRAKLDNDGRLIKYWADGQILAVANKPCGGDGAPAWVALVQWEEGKEVKGWCALAEHVWTARMEGPSNSPLLRRAPAKAKKEEVSP